jgi:hypothetical protein
MDYYDTSRWFVKLSNGETIYYTDEKTWYILKEYVESNGLDIVEMYLQFRSHIEPVMPEQWPEAEGFYFGIGVGCSLYQEHTDHLFFAGVLRGDVINIAEFKVPEIIPLFKGTRNPNDPNVQKKLIRNSSRTQPEKTI